MNCLLRPQQAQALRTVRGATLVPWGVDFLDDALLGVAETDLTLIGAWTGQGKTELATAVARNAVAQHKSVVFFALESEDREIEDRMMWGELVREWHRRHPQGKPGVHMRYASWRNGLLSDELDQIEEQIWPRFSLDIAGLRTVYKGEKGTFSVQDFCDAFEGVRHEADLIVVDHMHYFDLDDENENRALKNAVKKIRETALRHKKPVLLLAHLRKATRNSTTENVLPDIDDFYGHSDLVKIGVNVILVSRCERQGLASGNSPTWVHISKARHAGDAVNFAGLVGYDFKAGRYAPGYQLYRAKRWQEPELLRKEELPRWAKRARNAASDKGPRDQARLF